MGSPSRSRVAEWFRLICCAGALAAASGSAWALCPGTPCDPPGGFKPGFPKTVSGPGGQWLGAVHGHAVSADLGLTPGHKSIVFGTFGGLLWVVNHDGSVPAGFPLVLPADVMSTPAVGDLDGDGKPDIVVGYGSNFDPTHPGGVCAFKNNGPGLAFTQLWCRASGDALPGPPDGIPDPVLTSPAIGDVDGDGLPEVVFASFDEFVYVVKGSDGTDKPGWPVLVYDTVYSSPALFDLDSDGKLEIIIGGDGQPNQPPFYSSTGGGILWVFRYDGTNYAGFPQWVDQVIASPPAIGDIDGDGKPEIVVGTGTFFPNRTHAVYAFKCDGTQAAGWPVAVDGQVSTEPALADLDGDGKPDVIVTDDNSGPSGTFHVYAFKGNGTRLFKMQPKDYFGATLSLGNPVVADILGDSHPEILIPTNSEICVLDYTGRQLTDDGTHPQGGSSVSFYVGYTLTNVLVDDLETAGNTAVEVVAVSGTPFPTAQNTKVTVWNPKVSASIPWGMFRRDPRHTAVVPNTPPCLTVATNAALKFYTVTPCRVFDTRDTSTPLPPNSQATFQVTGPKCNLPATAKAVSANVFVVAPSTAGDIRVYAADHAAPLSSAINFKAGLTRCNNGVFALSATGAVGAQNDAPGSVHFGFDVNGYFQ